MANSSLNSKRQTLDRLLSKLGIASRGTSAEWIRAGRVRVNGKVVREVEAWVAWPKNSVSIDGKEIAESQRRFFLLHKPCGYVTTHSDEQGRKTIFELLPEEFGFLHAVGRLDKSTSGLLLLTNDSTLSHFLTEPANKIPRRYQLTVWGQFPEEKIATALRGVMDAGEKLQCDSLKILKYIKRETQLEAVLLQGKNREVRRLFEALGHKVTGLARLQYGPFTLGDLKLGAFQEVDLATVKKLLQLE